MTSKLLDAQNVSSITNKASSQKLYDDLLKTYSSMIWFMQLAGMGVAFSIITNTASISLSERKREYATLRVLGMHPREIGKILGFEYWLLSAGGIVLGIPLTGLIKQALANTMENDVFSMPVNTPVSSFAIAAVACLATVELCNLSSVRHIGKFDMVDVLKERE